MIGPGLPHDRPPLSKRALADRSRAAARRRGAARRARHRAHRRRRDRVRPRPPPARGQPARRRRHPLEIEAPTLVWATGLRYPQPPVPGFEQRGGELHRRGPRLARRDAGGAGQTRRRRRRRPDRHRDRRDARRRARRDAARHARPPAGALPPARVGGRRSSARRARRALPRLVQDRVRAAIDADGAVVHTSTHGDLALRRRRLGSRLPLEPPARARGPGRESAHRSRPTSSCA